MDSYWTKVNDATLRQGDFLPACHVPILYPDFNPDSTREVEVNEYDLIVVTQSCDLENQKARLVALCPIYKIAEFQHANKEFQKKGAWERVRQGRIEGLHLLASTTDPSDNQDARVVVFREIYSLPVEYLTNHAEALGDRSRLQSPFLEHFSQAFARFFMRVGLPSQIPKYA